MGNHCDDKSGKKGPCGPNPGNKPQEKHPQQNKMGEKGSCGPQNPKNPQQHPHKK